MHSSETSKIAAAYHNICDFVNNRFAVTQGQSVPEGALPTKSPKSTTLGSQQFCPKSRWDIECNTGAPARDPHLRTYLLMASLFL